MEVVINYENLNDFCEKNNFLIVSMDELKKENMYVDLRYATDNNFVGYRVYPENMPIIINKIIWDKMKKINNSLKEKGLCLLILDAYRPIEIQKIFWDFYISQNNSEDETLVANPNKYGTHNITMNAIDIMPLKLDGSFIELPSEFDDFTGKANIHYDGCSENAKINRDKFIEIVTSNGMIVNEDEWWHFYDNSLLEYGMKYNYKDSKFKPVDEEITFKLVKGEDDMDKDMVYYKKMIYKDIALLCALSMISIIGGAIARSNLVALCSIGFLIVEFIMLKIKKEKVLGIFSMIFGVSMCSLFLIERSLFSFLYLFFGFFFIIHVFYFLKKIQSNN